MEQVNKADDRSPGVSPQSSSASKFPPSDVPVRRYQVIAGFAGHQRLACSFHNAASSSSRAGNLQQPADISDDFSMACTRFMGERQTGNSLLPCRAPHHSAEWQENQLLNGPSKSAPFRPGGDPRIRSIAVHCEQAPRNVSAAILGASSMVRCNARRAAATASARSARGRPLSAKAVLNAKLF